jgi:phosphoglycolate phosphatase
VQRSGLLIFDLDGTLFQAHTVSIPATQETFRAFGLPVPPTEEILPFFGRPTADWHAWLRARCPPELAEQAVAAIDRRELELVGETGELYPGVREALAALRAEVATMAICSNGPHDYVERVLSSQGIATIFDVVRYRQADGKDKPRMVAELLERLSDRPGIVIGDRWDDVAAAHENGLRAIGAAYGYGPLKELVEADALAHAPWELPGLVLVLLGSDSRKRPSTPEPRGRRQRAGPGDGMGRSGPGGARAGRAVLRPTKPNRPRAAIRPTLRSAPPLAPAPASAAD